MWISASLSKQSTDWTAAPRNWRISQKRATSAKGLPKLSPTILPTERSRGKLQRTGSVQPGGLRRQLRRPASRRIRKRVSKPGRLSGKLLGGGAPKTARFFHNVTTENQNTKEHLTQKQKKSKRTRNHKTQYPKRALNHRTRKPKRTHQNRTNIIRGPTKIRNKRTKETDIIGHKKQQKETDIKTQDSPDNTNHVTKVTQAREKDTSKQASETNYQKQNPLETNKGVTEEKGGDRKKQHTYSGRGTTEDKEKPYEVREVKDNRQDTKTEKRKEGIPKGTHTKDVTTQEARISNILIEGGEWMGDSCISNKEINKVLLDLCPQGDFLNAEEFFLWRTGETSTTTFRERLATKKRGNGRLFIIVHVRHHWLLAVLNVDDSVTVYDSAPSKVVAQDLAKLATILGWNITYNRSPKQTRDSNECGIFVIWHIFRIVHNATVETPPLQEVIRLGEARRHLRDLNWEELRRMWLNDFPEDDDSGSKTMIRGGDWNNSLSNEEIDEALRYHKIHSVSAAMAADFTQGLTLLETLGDTVAIPIWNDGHWIAGLKRNGTLLLMDSGGSDRRLLFGDIATKAQHARICDVTKVVKVPKQPPNSDQYGVHLIINTILGVHGIFLEHEMMDYTRFRERRVQFSVTELLDAIIKTDEREVATFKKGDRILWRSTSQWCIGEVEAERRNMNAISGHIINDEQESIQPAPPIAPQYQILERTSTPDEEQPAP